MSITEHEIKVTRFGKIDRIVTTSELAFIAPCQRYIHILFKTQTTRDGQVYFSTRLFLGHTKCWKANTDGKGPLVGFNRMAWTQIISYALTLSSVVVCDWCSGLFTWFSKVQLKRRVGIICNKLIYSNI